MFILLWNDSVSEPLKITLYVLFSPILVSFSYNWTTAETIQINKLVLRSINQVWCDSELRGSFVTWKVLKHLAWILPPVLILPCSELTEGSYEAFDASWVKHGKMRKWCSTMLSRLSLVSHYLVFFVNKLECQWSTLGILFLSLFEELQGHWSSLSDITTEQSDHMNNLTLQPNVS